MRCCTTSALATGALLATLASLSFAQTARDQPHVAPPTVDWPTNGGDWYNRRYSPLTQIDRSNVAKLKGVWRARLGGSGVGPQYSGEAQPLVVDGVVYISTGANDVFAISVDTGTTLWDYHANLDPDNKSVCCSWTNRGVAAGGGKIFVGQLDGKLVALDAKSGKIAWSILAEKPQDGFTITAAPLYYNGLVIVGFAGAELGVRGRVRAYDARDGKLVWTFYTIPGRGEPGNETWPQDNEIWQHGGATVWQTPAVDPELGLIFFSTGNPGPDFNGAIRKGDNLYTSSIMALDAKTGKYRWHFQQVHHDLWDYDSASPVVLFDITLDGKPRKGHRGSQQVGLGVHPRPHRRQTARRHRRARRAAGAAPGDGRHAAVSARRRVRAAVGRHRTRGLHARERRQDLHAVLDRLHGREARHQRRRELAAECARCGSGHLFVCARDNASTFRAWDIEPTQTAGWRALHRRQLRQQPVAAAGHVHRARHAHEQDRVATALGQHLQQRRDRDGRRPRVRRPQRRPAHGARFEQRRASCGSSRPAPA